MAVIPALQRLRQKGCEFKTNLGCTEAPNLKTNNKNPSFPPGLPSGVPVHQGEMLQGIRIGKRQGMYGWLLHFASCVCWGPAGRPTMAPVLGVSPHIPGSGVDLSRVPHVLRAPPGPSTAPGAVWHACEQTQSKAGRIPGPERGARGGEPGSGARVIRQQLSWRQAGRSGGDRPTPWVLAPPPVPCASLLALLELGRVSLGRCREGASGSSKPGPPRKPGQGPLR